jgi:PhnB protein
MKSGTYYDFDGNAKDIASFCHDVFGGKLEMVMFNDGYKNYPQAEANWSEKVWNFSLKNSKGEIIVAGWDNPDLSGFPQSVAVTLEYAPHEFTEGRDAFKNLCENGRVISEFKKSSWSNDYFGECEDKNKLAWKITCKA